MDKTARQVKEIRLEYGWLRRPARRAVGAQELAGLGIEATQEGRALGVEWELRIARAGSGCV